MRHWYYISILTGMPYFGLLVYLLATDQISNPILFAIITPLSLYGFIASLIKLSKEKR